MKNVLLFALVLLLSVGEAQAAAGDTTWVYANNDELSWNGNYDSTVAFPAPGGRYRNIYMVVTIGKYVCPGTPTYCGDWDYTVQNFLIVPGGDMFELGRLITPYANSGAPRTPGTWQHRYVYDVTEYASLLQDTATVRIHYSGYSGGFTGNVKFAFVEGIPERDVIGIDRLWHGSFSYGGSTDINTRLSTVSKVAPDGTESASMKFNVTGHGSDNNGCCEFMSTNYRVVLNSTTVGSKAIWRDDCPSNELYPQSGTWLYERANWCPGASVQSNWHPLPGVRGGNPFDVAIRFDPYTSPGGGLGSYITEAHLIYYGRFNNLKDAAIVDIVSPTDNENHFRENPTCDAPSIIVKNRGENTITLLSFEYGIQGGAMQTYTWAGSLSSLKSTEIVLPALMELNGIAGDGNKHTFVAKITSVNGSDDRDSTNNIMTSTFNSAPKWDPQFRIMFKPNNQSSGGVSETKWRIYDQDNNVVASRVDATISTLYIDTLTLGTGCYRLEITDESCDGLHWWVYDRNPSIGITAGAFFVKKVGSNANIDMDGYTYSGTYSNDFGCNFTQYFYVDNPSGVSDITLAPLSMAVYPNPAQGVVYADISGVRQVSGTLQMIDMVGRVIKNMPCNQAHQEIDITGLNTGIYTLVFIDNSGNKLQQRVSILK